MNDKHIDLVLEGGGIKGIGISGAYTILEQAGYSVQRVAGTSAGAIMAALIAAGYNAKELHDIVSKLDYGNFADLGWIDRFGVAGQSLSVLFEKGIFEGNYIRQLVYDLLDKKGVRTFGDLKMASAGAGSNDSYKLVILATDVTRAKLIRLPWDYHEYGLDPDTQLVADAVRASTAVPFYYEPSRLGDNYIVDGGVVSNFPIWVFEEGPHQHSQTRPTIGVKLSALETTRRMRRKEKITNTFSYAFSIISTILDAQDQLHLNDPCTIKQTIFVDADTVTSMNFSITPEQQKKLYENGIMATEKFLRKWDYQEFLRTCRGVKPRQISSEYGDLK